MGKAAAVLGEFSGGVYSLDAEGTVLSSFPLDILRPIALDPFAGPDVQVLLVDQRCVVVGASEPGLAGKNVGGNPWIQRIFAVEPSDQGTFLDDQKMVAAFPVSNSPFLLVAVDGQLMR